MNQNFTIKLLDIHIEAVFCSALPQSPHTAAAASTESCFLFTVCRYNAIPISHPCFIANDIDQSQDSIMATNQRRMLIYV